MPRRVAAISLLLAWLCTSGAMLDLAQLAAWTRMFAGYATTETLCAAACDTFDPGKPCEICRAVGRARNAGGHQAPAIAPQSATKLVLILEPSVPFFCEHTERWWAEPASASAPSRVSEVLVPPPRAA